MTEDLFDTLAPDVGALLGTGYDRGLSAGLAEVLAGVDIRSCAPGGIAAVPVGPTVPGAEPVPMSAAAAAESVAVVRFPDSAGGTGLDGPTSGRLAAVRLGVLMRMLDAAVAHLSARTSAGTPLIEKQLVVGSIADLVTEAETIRLALESTAAGLSAAIAASWHDQLSELGWEVAKLFGARGYLGDHPVRSLQVSDLVANVWVVAGEPR